MSQTLKLQIVRLAIALVFGLIVFGLSFRAGWKSAEGSPYVAWERYGTWDGLRQVDWAIDNYRKEHGALPSSLASLCSSDDASYVRCQSDGSILDGWGKPLHYSVMGKEYLVVSYGMDGKPGGFGLDADISNKSSYSLLSPVTLSQFIHLPAARDMIETAIISGLVAMVLGWALATPKNLERTRWPKLAGLLLITLLASIFVAAIITAMHIPSGH